MSLDAKFTLLCFPYHQTLTPHAKFRLPQTKLQLVLNQNWAVTVTSRICIEFHSPTYLSHYPHKLVSRVQVLTAIRTIVSMPNILNRRGYRSSAYLGWNVKRLNKLTQLTLEIYKQKYSRQYFYSYSSTILFYTERHSLVLAIYLV